VGPQLCSQPMSHLLSDRFCLCCFDPMNVGIPAPVGELAFGVLANGGF